MSSLDQGEPPTIGGDSALFLDFDGTLAEIQHHPDTVLMPDHAETALGALCERLGGAIAVISGRDIRDLCARLPAALWRVGGHGIDVCPPGAPPAGAPGAPPEGLTAAVGALATPDGGVWVERKGPLLAVHYRAAPDEEARLAAALAEILAGFEDYKLQANKMVFEAKPRAADKGAAVKELMTEPPFLGRTPVMAGDDRTDEDGFAAVQALGGYGVKVGEGPSVARYRLGGINRVWRWLEAWESA